MFCSFLQGGGVYVYSSTVTMTSCSITGNTASRSVRAHVETSHRPDGIFTCFALVLAQGGGVYFESGTVTFSSCTITGNSAQYVRAHAQKFPSPRWENADVLALTHACTTAADTLVNYRECVLQRP